MGGAARVSDEMGVEDKSSFKGPRTVGLPAYLLADRKICDRESKMVKESRIIVKVCEWF